MAQHASTPTAVPRGGPINWVIRFCLENKLVVLLLVAAILAIGLYVMPFKHEIKGFPSDPIPVDAIPDIGENQQIVFTDWMGRSPQDVEDQVTYPLTVALQGTPGVKSVRGLSMFGFSTVYVIFHDDVDFYWARSRLLERLSTAQQKLPAGAVSAMGPDATALGQVFWYTLEGEGFDLQELRSIQDWQVRYALQAVEGVSEVASVGGYVKEYQVDADPAAMLARGVTLSELMMAVGKSNIDVGAETVDFNGVEYLVRGKGFVKSVADLEEAVVRSAGGVPIRVKDVARVQLGPALRRGALDKAGAEAVGGVVVVRYGANPREVIDRVKERITQVAPGLPAKTLPDGRVSRVRIEPFYDRTTLIEETLQTLSDALVEEILITCFVVFLLMAHFRSNLLISANLPLAVAVAFILMKVFRVDSNLMSLGGIAIAIGTMVDMGIILCENIVRHFDEARPGEDPLEVVYRAASEVGSAVITAIATTLVSFMPVFALTGAEGKLFRPLAYTKTFALFASVFVALTVLPAAAHLLFKWWPPRREDGPGPDLSWRNWLRRPRTVAYGTLALLGIAVAVRWSAWAGLPLVAAGAFLALEPRLPERLRRHAPQATAWLAAGFVLVLLTLHWMPLGLGTGVLRNLVFVFGINIAWTSLRLVFIRWYPVLVRAFLRHKLAFLAVPTAMVILGTTVLLGFGKIFNRVPEAFGQKAASRVYGTKIYSWALHRFPGMGKEFMPSLDEGSFLFMPTTMPHASLGEAFDILQKQDIAIRAIPEVDGVVGKIGRAETAIDPAPISMVETVVTYKPEWNSPDPKTGRRRRNWREQVKSPDDIWKEIVKAAQVPGSTGAPELQPIAARIVMLQSGMRAPMGVKVYGKTLQEIERFGNDIARFLKEVPGVSPEAVVPDQVVAKPYLEIELDRIKLALYGVSIRDAQDVIEAALGGMTVTQTVEGRERYPVRVRYARELRDSIEAMGRILVPTNLASGSGGMSAVESGASAQIPLSEVATIRFTTGPQEIKSEGTELVSYVLFDKLPDFAEVDVVEAADRHMKEMEKSGQLIRPTGAQYEFAGSYRNQLNFMKTFVPVLLLSLFSIFIILYFQFRSVPVTFLIFGQIAVGFAGGFVGMWLAAQPWFLNFAVFGSNLREVFHLQQYNLSVAVWVGFIAMFGVATDDQVVIITYLQQLFSARRPSSIQEIRALVGEGARKRVRPCLMTTATTVLALLPVLTSQGRGADVMIPMAMPLVGAMTFDMLNLFSTPVLYSAYQEFLARSGWSDGRAGAVLFGVCALCALPAVPAGLLPAAGAFIAGLIPCFMAMLIYNALRESRPASAE